MIENMFDFNEYFPLVIQDENLKNYIEKHIESLSKCIENELYISAYPHLHILFMSFVYFQLLRISQEKSIEFNYCWIGFPSEEKNFLTKPDHPLSFSKVKEKSVFRFFRLVGFGDGLIGDISSLIERRNKTLHASGSLICNNALEFSKEYDLYQSKMDRIIENQKDFLVKIYNQILTDFPEDYLVTEDDIELGFGNFSFNELQLQSLKRKDVVSRFLRSEYFYN